MLTSIETFRSRCGIQTTELDVHIRNALRAAQDQVSDWLGQPVERSTLVGTTSAIPHASSDRLVAVVDASIDVNLLSLYRDFDGVDIASQCSTLGNLIYLPSSEELGTTYRYTIECGWTPSSAPFIVLDTIYAIAYYLMLQTHLLQVSAAAITSESRSENGVVTTSRNYDEQYVQRQLERVKRWRLLLASGGYQSKSA